MCLILSDTSLVFEDSESEMNRFLIISDHIYHYADLSVKMKIFMFISCTALLT